MKKLPIYLLLFLAFSLTPLQAERDPVRLTRPHAGTTYRSPHDGLGEDV